MTGEWGEVVEPWRATELGNWKVKLWNLVAKHPDVSPYLFSDRNRIANHVIDQAVEDIAELVRQQQASSDGWMEDYYRRHRR